MIEALKGFLSDHSIIITISTAAVNVVMSQIEMVTAPLVAILSIIILVSTAVVKVEEAYQKIKSWRAKVKVTVETEKTKQTKQDEFKSDSKDISG